ncbi:hypothetical protein M7I_6753 [Glarea lozoyensis 74030]|uniref:Uncharacterized protein n=1 Tax=Glarea lozoyensis (strain ATCC 74030 / MF5533) TaxID=1104152 RepID=H0EVF5_GLAL7|nr:hypothetical protein M7I_6753 [Glarea lozoyensis 74030]
MEICGVEIFRNDSKLNMDDVSKDDTTVNHMVVRILKEGSRIAFA